VLLAACCCSARKSSSDRRVKQSLLRGGIQNYYDDPHDLASGSSASVGTLHMT
jgi:hypothetical protein